MKEELVNIKKKGKHEKMKMYSNRFFFFLLKYTSPNNWTFRGKSVDSHAIKNLYVHTLTFDIHRYNAQN